MNEKLQNCIKTIQGLALDNFKAAIEAETYYSNKNAQVRAISFMAAANIIREALGLYEGPILSHSDKSVGLTTGLKESQA